MQLEHITLNVWVGGSSCSSCWWLHVLLNSGVVAQAEPKDFRSKLVTHYLGQNEDGLRVRPLH
jgi:hypothetical protein